MGEPEPKAEGRRNSLAVVGGVMAGAGTLIASMVGLITVFGGDDAPAPPATTVVVSAQPFTSPPASTQELPEYESFVRVQDDTGVISVEVPAEWTNIRGDGFNTNPRPSTGGSGRG